MGSGLLQRAAKAGWLIVLGLIVGAGGDRLLMAQTTPEAGAPAIEEPLVLSPAEVEHGLVTRIQQMEDRHETRRTSRLLDGARDYTAPEIVDTTVTTGQAPIPLPPDAAGGEVEIERRGGGK